MLATLHNKMNNLNLPPDMIFGVQFMVMMVVNILVASWYLIPWIRRVSFKDALSAMLLLHITRVIGLAFIVSAVTDPTLPRGLAFMAAGGRFRSSNAKLACTLVCSKESSWHQGNDCPSQHCGFCRSNDCIHLGINHARDISELPSWSSMVHSHIYRTYHDGHPRTDALACFCALTFSQKITFLTIGDGSHLL